MIGDYGGGKHVSPDEAKETVEESKTILRAVKKSHLELDES